MFNINFKIALRNLWRNKGFAAINIIGLTLGLSAAILIALFVYDEYQFDKAIPSSQQIYRVVNESHNELGEEMRAVTPPAYATTLMKDFPEVERTARVMMQPKYKALFETDRVKLYEENGFLADSTFFDVFNLPMVYGSSKGLLDDPTSIVISDEMSYRFFGEENPVGKQLSREKVNFKVSGVFKKDPYFHLSFDFIMPLSTAKLPAERMQSWGWQQFFTYVQLKRGTNKEAFEKKFTAAVKEKSAEQLKDSKLSFFPHLQALNDVHLKSSEFKFDESKRGNITYVKALMIIAVFILLIACFNFVNLATSRSVLRAKEVGVRKTIGAEKRQLLLQFLSETFLLCFISIALAFILSALLLPSLNQFTGKNIHFQLLLHPVTLAMLVALGILIGTLAGFYPAIVLSSFKPVAVLRKNIGSGDSETNTPWLRYSLVTLQFTLSVLLIISALMVFRQVNYMQNKDLGFNKEQIVFFPMRGSKFDNNIEAFKNDLLQSSAISSVSIGYGFPGDAVAGDDIILPANGRNDHRPATQLMVDFDYVKTLGLKIIAGRDFSKDMKTDKDHAFIINETAVKLLGFETPEKAIGKDLTWNPWSATNPDSLKLGKVIGVVKDFHYKSLYDKVELTVLQISEDQFKWKVAVKMNTAGLAGTMAHIEKVWSKYAPDYPLEYKFLDENFSVMYTMEEKLKFLLWIFTSVAIIVGCLGLLGLAAHSAERRRKEIGIRKILGASVSNIFGLLSKEFVLMIGIAVAIASPIAWLALDQWLRKFAYRTDLSWWIFLVAGATAIAIALLTISYQAIKAAMVNPVNSLRTE